MKSAIAITYFSLASLLVLSGCSTVCPEGLKFGLYGAMCAPYETVKLIQQVHRDMQPGGMLNPNSRREQKQSDNESADKAVTTEYENKDSSDGETLKDK